ncbi:MAG TPA: hypothetical protein DCG49_10945 [Ruminococcus sp.]|nr:hypothetical protein [Ruminococcus sp.]
MRKYLTAYIAALEAKLASGQELDYAELEQSHLTMIQFMQHERLIHFLVTMLFAIVFFMVFLAFLLSGMMGLLPLMFMILVLLVPYIAHYYFLENTVQKMYRMHDEIHLRRLKYTKDAAQEP